MDSVNIQTFNGASFVFSRQLAPWAMVLPLSTGRFRAYMRTKLDDPVVMYQWSSDNGRIQFVPSYANGMVAYTSNPIADTETLTFGSTLVPFVSGTPTGLQVQVGPTLGATLNSLIALLQSSLDSQLQLCSFSLNGTELGIQYKTTDIAGNLFTINSSSGNNPASGPTLTGAGGLLLMTAPIADLQRFIGTYVYDCRWEGPDGSIIQLFGGTIEFQEGVTR